MSVIKKFVSGLSVSTLALSLCMSSLSLPAQAFTDIQDTADYTSPATELFRLGIVSGFADGKFRPDDLVTRGQMAKFVRNAVYGKDYVNLECEHFSDVDESYLFFMEITTLKCEGVVSGYGDGKYYPEESITRAQAVKIAIEAGRKFYQDNQFLEVKTKKYENNGYVKDIQGHLFANYLLTALNSEMLFTNSSFVADGTMVYPDEYMNRGDMSNAVWKLMQGKNLKVNTVEPKNAGLYIKEVTDLSSNMIACQDVAIGRVDYLAQGYDMMSVYGGAFNLPTQKQDEINKLKNVASAIAELSKEDFGFDAKCNNGDVYEGIYQRDLQVEYTGADKEKTVLYLVTSFYQPFVELNIRTFAIKNDDLIILNTVLKPEELLPFNIINSCQNLANPDANGETKLAENAKVVDCFTHYLNSNASIRKQIQTKADQLVKVFELNS